MSRIPTRVYREMEDQIAALVNKSVKMEDLKRIHARIIVCSMAQSNFLATKLVTFAGANGEAAHAELIFKQVFDPNNFLCNAMVRAYTQCCAYPNALMLYRQMLFHLGAEIPISPDKFTYPFVLKSCTALLLLDLGRQIHSQICRSGWGSASVVENSLLEMYVKCNDLNQAHVLFDEMADRDVVSWNTIITGHARRGQMKKARTLFNSMPRKNVISWTVLISGYSRIGCYTEALDVFRQMQVMSIMPDDIAIVSVLPACAELGALESGKWIHTFCEKNKILHKTHICNALIEMYAKCGSINQAWRMFIDMPNKDVISWSTMIGGFAHHGLARKAMELFTLMESEGRVKPNTVTFLALLSACAHAGFLAEGLQYFDSMVKVYCLPPGIEHYGCMVDLLGRSGLINKALELINGMPIPPDAAIWGSLICACKTYGDIETAIIAIDHLVQLEPNDAGNYVILSNIYASAGRWDRVSELRKLIRAKHVMRKPGSSLIEVDNVVTEFIAGDDSNPQTAEISEILELFSLQNSEMDASLDHDECECW